MIYFSNIMSMSFWIGGFNVDYEIILILIIYKLINIFVDSDIER